MRAHDRLQQAQSRGYMRGGTSCNLNQSPLGDHISRIYHLDDKWTKGHDYSSKFLERKRRETDEECRSLTVRYSVNWTRNRDDPIQFFLTFSRIRPLSAKYKTKLSLFLKHEKVGHFLSRPCLEDLGLRSRVGFVRVVGLRARPDAQAPHHPRSDQQQKQNLKAFKRNLNNHINPSSHSSALDSSFNLSRLQKETNKQQK